MLYILHAVVTYFYGHGKATAMSLAVQSFLRYLYGEGRKFSGGIVAKTLCSIQVCSQPYQESQESDPRKKEQ
jgi:hypothetical protein